MAFGHDGDRHFIRTALPGTSRLAQPSTLEHSDKPSRGTGGNFDTLRFSLDCNTFTIVKLLINI